ncbi:MAG: extracellular solute-binding protein [Paenibacillaceae bacterium]|nr:extracellular solute-binding protein [Paenibacillaceae bacterium]
MHTRGTYGKLMQGTAAVLGTAVLLAGCGGTKSEGTGASASPQSSAPAASAKAPEKEVKLTMWVKSTPEEQELFKTEAAAFKKDNPAITVEIVPFGTDQYISALQAAISGSSLPDIFQLAPQIPLTQLKKLDLVQPLAFDQKYMDQFEDGTWLAGKTTLDNKPYVWPNRSFKTAASVMFYNKKVMRDMGLNPDKPPATWDELAAQAKIVTDKGGGSIYGISAGLKQDWFVEQLVQQMATSVDGKGIQSVADFARMTDWKTGTLFQPNAVKVTAEAFKQWMANKIINPNALIWTSAESAASFGEGKAAFDLEGQWQLAFFKSKYPNLEFGVAMLPSKSGTPSYYGTVGGSETGFVVSKKAANMEATTKWLTYLTQQHYINAAQKYIALSPLKNADATNVGPEWKQIVDVSNQMFRVVPAPWVKNPVELDVMTALKAKTAKQPLGATLQTYWNNGNVNLDKYLADYAAEQQTFLQDAVKSVQGAKLEDWSFPNWDINTNFTQDKYGK